MDSSQQQSPPLPSKESLIRRYKPIWRVLLISNLALGGYMFAKARKKNSSVENSKAAKPSAEDSKAAAEVSSSLTPASSVAEEPLVLPTVIEPVKAREPIPEDQQRELFKWVLEEKRKVKPKDLEEKKRIDEEKAILKQFIRAESIPKV
ncbi:WAS/WASL-interacting family protein [Melia azedarach]|uniref:WAS/WASL-interacting family protein n=1 Tax=Melia azedarach TaxID=155640 RepID=A0ACC1XD00_MELAZ|nr:WAS/WASL-interacting family protein [Melia azedarach]